MSRGIRCGWGLIAALCVLLGLPVVATGTPTLEERLATFVRARARDASVRIEVPPIPVDPQERASLDATFSLHPRQRLSGRVPVRIGLSMNGQHVRTIVLPVDVIPTRQVLVATRVIRAGEPIPKLALRLEERSGAQLPRDAITDLNALDGQRARRRLPAGKALRASWLEDATDVRRGQPVRLVLRRGGLLIEATGRAQEDGNLGDWIAVQNSGSRKTVRARVGPDGALHVEP